MSYRCKAGQIIQSLSYKKSQFITNISVSLLKTLSYLLQVL